MAAQTEEEDIVTEGHPPIEMQISRHGSWTVAEVRGDLDIATAPQLESAFETADGLVALDLAKVRFIDSTGLRALVQLRDAQQKVVLVNPSTVVKRLLELTQMSDAFPVAATVDALDSMG